MVPSITELLFDLGLDDEVVGITRFCIYPSDRTTLKTRIGGTKSIDIEKALLLKPDLIISNKEENTKDDVERLSTACPVWVSDVHNLETAIDLVFKLGEVTGKSIIAESLARNINASFTEFKPTPTLSAAYLIWNQPIMVLS